MQCWSPPKWLQVNASLCKAWLNRVKSTPKFSTFIYLEVCFAWSIFTLGAFDFSRKGRMCASLHNDIICFVWFMPSFNVPTQTMHSKAGKQGVQYWWGSSIQTLGAPIKKRKYRHALLVCTGNDLDESHFSLSYFLADVLSEDTIIKWYKGGHSSKGKNLFLTQMKNMVEWLQNAEEGLLHVYVNWCYNLSSKKHNYIKSASSQRETVWHHG